MILLNASVQSELFGDLKVPPTHAYCHGYHRRLFNQLVSGEQILGIQVDYSYGTLNAESVFVRMNNTTTAHFNIPNTKVDAKIAKQLLSNLLNAGIVPHPTEPLTAVAAPSKKAGDLKTCDIDAIMIYLHPDKFGGTVV